MEGRLLLKNCAVFRADGRVRTGMALVVQDGLIRRVAPDAEVPVLPGDWEVACRGRARGSRAWWTATRTSSAASSCRPRATSCCGAPPPGWSGASRWPRC